MTELIRDRYEVVEVVASSPRGELVRAVDRQLGRDVAIKIRAVPRDAFRTVLQDETGALIRLPAIAQLPLVRDAFFEDDRHYLVTDWIEGSTLGAILADKGDPGLRFRTVAEYLQPVAAALDHLHAQRPPVVHGDVRPESIVVTDGGQVVLVGLGNATPKPWKEGDLGGHRAPELASRMRLTPATDYFGLAATAMWLLSGAPPGDGDGSIREQSQRAKQTIRRVVRRAMDPDPAARRFASCAELIEKLGAWTEAELPTGTVTFLLSDIEGSTRMWETDGDAMSRSLARHDEIFADTVENHGGVLVKTRGEGDATFSVFGRAGAALRCALDLQAQLGSEAWPTTAPVTVRMALHTGEAEIRDGDYFGPVVNRAARIRSIGAGGQTLVSDATHELVRDQLPSGVTTHRLGAVELKDMSRAEQVFLVLPEGVAPPEEPPVAAVTSPEPTAGRRSTRRVPVPLTVVFTVVIALIAALVGLRGDGDGATEGDAGGLQLVADRIEFEDKRTGVTIRRTWTIEPEAEGGPVLHGFLRAINKTGKDRRNIVLDEVFPPSLVDSIDDVAFDPAPRFSLSLEAPVGVRYRVPLLVEDGLRTFEYRVPLTIEPGVTSADLLEMWEAEEIQAQTEIRKEPRPFQREEQPEPAAGPLEGRIVISGSGTVFRIADAIEPLFEDDHPKVRIDLTKQGTTAGFERFCAGDLDIGNAASPMDAATAKRCERNGIAHEEFAVAVDGLTVIAHPGAAWLDCLSVDELAAIWEPGSKVRRWDQVRDGFPAEDIALFGPRETAGTYDAFMSLVVGGSAGRQDFRGFADFDKIAAGVGADPSALGYFAYPNFLENRAKVRAVPIRGAGGACVEPSDESVADGTYELTRKLFMYVNAVDLAKEHVKAFLTFVLDEAPKLLPELGFSPIDEALRERQKATIAAARL